MENVAKPSIVLRPLEFTDFPEVLLWSQDVQFCEANGWILNQNEHQLLKWWSAHVESTSEDFFRIGIEWDHRLIGYVDFAEVRNGSAEIGIAIGDSTLWQKGLGRQAFAQGLEYASNLYSLHTYKAETETSNIRAQKLLTRQGFKEINQLGSTIYYEYTI